MLDLLVISAVRRKVVALFAINPDHELYPRQIAQIISESPHAVGLELKYLTEGGLLKKLERGNRVFYKFNEGYPYASLIKDTVKKMLQEGDHEVAALPDLSRKELLDENLKRVVEDIKKYYDPGRIIVFGSVVTGKVGPYSDIDLVLIKKTSVPYFKRAQQLVDLLDYDVDIDFMIYTPEEFERSVKEKRFFSEEILKKGRVLYEKAA